MSEAGGTGPSAAPQGDNTIDVVLSEAKDLLVARIKQLENAARALDPGAGRRKKLRNAVMAASERHIRKLMWMKGYMEDTDKGAGLRAMKVNGNGHELDEVIELLEREIVKPGAHPSSATLLAFIPGSSLYHAALADFMAAVTNKYSTVFFSSPGGARVENMMVRWVGDLIGYPATALGYIASGGSMANLTAVVTARDAHGVKSERVPKAVVYLTEQTHHCVQKALKISGLADAQVRYVDMDERYRMRPDALATAIATDRASGLQPWLVVASAGSTDVGAVDPLDAIADVAQREKCWYHVDAAYGGFFMLTDYGRTLLKGIERSDSAVLDPHKGLFLPWGAGVVIVRDGKHLEASHNYTGHYMQDTLNASEEVSPADISPELSRPFRGLRMWMPLMLIGTKPFSAALEEKLLLARYFRSEVEKRGFEVGPEPALTVVTYRWAPAGKSLDEVNELNRRIIEGTHRDGRVLMTSTMIGGKFTLRLVALSFRTHKRTIDLALRVLDEQIAALG